MSARPLAGVRVLDLGQVYNGPYCGMLLQAQGAEVIKVEPPSGEIVRRAAVSPGGASYSFLMLNAGKLGITLNLKEPRGRALFLDLVEKSDVVLENFSDGAMDRLDLGYPVLAARNPRLIQGSGRGYRSGSRYEEFGAMDFTVQAISGHMAITGFPGQPPVKAGATLCDMLGSTHLFAAILLALRDRDQTGRGRHVDVAMLDATFPALMAYTSPYLERGFDAGQTGNHHSQRGSSPYGTYATSDGWVTISALTDAHYARFVEITGDSVLEANPAWREAPARGAAHAEIDARTEVWTRTLKRDEVVAILTENRIPCAPVRTIAEACDDPYLEEEAVLRRTTYPEHGEVRVLGSPIQLRDGAGAADSDRTAAPPPRLGEHNDRIYGDLLGLDDSTRSSLAEEGII